MRMLRFRHAASTVRSFGNYTSGAQLSVPAPRRPSSRQIFGSSANTNFDVDRLSKNFVDDTLVSSCAKRCSLGRVPLIRLRACNLPWVLTTLRL